MRRLIRKAEANLEVNNGDLVDFGPYGKLYVCNVDYEEDIHISGETIHQVGWGKDTAS